jgi:hypothetical protein
VKITKKATDPSTAKGLRQEKRLLKKLAEEISAGLPMQNNCGSKRRQIISQLLELAAHPKRKTFVVNVVKAAVELYSYNDVFAAGLLNYMVNNEYPGYIQHLKGTKELESL